MKVGCGFVEKEIRGNRYLYFWCFQGRGAIRVRDRLVDAVHYRGAKKTLERAGL